jgi:hypothetical protein
MTNRSKVKGRYCSINPDKAWDIVSRRKVAQEMNAAALAKIDRPLRTPAAAKETPTTAATIPTENIP